MHHREQAGFRAVLAGCVVTGLAMTAGAQESAAERIPTIPYIDKAFGFELQIPAGWNYDRTGFFGPGGSLGLLRGAAVDGRATLQILAFRELQLPSFPEWIESFSERLGSIDGTQRVRVKGVPAAERSAAYVIAEAQIGVERTRALYYCVQFDENTVWVFSLATVLGTTVGAGDTGPEEHSMEVVVPAEFTELAETLRVFYDPQIAREIAAAQQRGEEFLARTRLEDAIRDLRIDDSVRYYEIHLAGKPIGYMTRQITREAEPLQRPGQLSNAKEGLRVRERSYRFTDNETTEVSRIDLFSSADGQTDVYELWHAQIASPGAGAPEPLITCDQCVREGRTLFSSYSTSRDEGLPEPRQPLKLDATYLGLSWARLLPALLGPQARPMHAFTVYDPETRTLITHAVTPLGEKRVPGLAETTSFAFELRTGFTETPGVVFTDASGNMLRFEAGKLILTLSDKPTIERTYGTRRDRANAPLRQGR